MGIDFEPLFSDLAGNMKASEIRELLKLTAEQCGTIAAPAILTARTPPNVPPEDVVAMLDATYELAACGEEKR